MQLMADGKATWNKEVGKKAIVKKQVMYKS